MSDDIVSISLEGTPDTVTIDAGTPVVTIEGSTDTVSISPEPSVVIVTNTKPEVVISYNFAKDIGQTALLAMLDDVLDIDQFAPGLNDDIVLLRDLWTRVGRDIQDVLVDADVTSITQISSSYTDLQIQTVAVDIQANNAGIVANTSAITQTASTINLRVDQVELDATNDLLVQTARIDVNSTAISLNVSRMDATDITISSQQSSITQNADQITLEVAARVALANGAVATNTSTTTQTATSLVSVVAANDQLAGRADSAETRLTATEQVTTILTRDVADAQYSIKAVQSLTSSSFGVTITEDTGGIPYVAGFEMIVHPTWLTAKVYRVDELMHSVTGNLIYKCILDHLSETANYPIGVSNTWWELQDNAPTSEFNIQAEHFSIITPGGLVPVFEVDGGTGAVTMTGSLAVNIVKSLNYDDQIASETWYKLDATDGTADFNNIVMTFGSSVAKDVFTAAVGIDDAEAAAKAYADNNFVTTVLYDIDIAAIQSQIDGNITSWFYSGVPTLINVPASTWTTDELKDQHLGDLYYDDVTGYAYRFLVAATVYSWTQLSDSDITAALSAANDAQDTADNKRRVFVVTPSGPYDIGDLWDTGDGIKRATADRVSGYNASEWVLISDITASSAFVTVTYPSDISDLEGLIEDGKLDTWYVTTDPSITWSGTDASHTGDMWWNLTSKKLKRWSGTAWSADIEDQLAIDAYADAADAQDTADGKRRVFVVEPTGPYDIGDLWSTASGGVLTANTARTSGYLLSEWTGTADVTQTVIDGNVITTGYISDHLTAPTLKIDFLNAAITVNSANGLLVTAASGVVVNSATGIIVNSDGGISVSGGGGILINDTGNITVNDGGDINLKSSASDSAELRLYNASNSLKSKIGIHNTADYALYLDPVGSSQNMGIGISDRWETVAVYTDNIIVLQSGTGTDSAEIILTRAVSPSTNYDVQITADSGTKYNYIKVRADSATVASNYIEQAVGSYSTKMTDYGITIHKGNLVMSYLSTTYDTLIPNNGDWFFFVASDISYRLYLRQRRSNGVCYSSAV